MGVVSYPVKVQQGTARLTLSQDRDAPAMLLNIPRGYQVEHQPDATAVPPFDVFQIGRERNPTAQMAVFIREGDLWSFDSETEEGALFRRTAGSWHRWKDVIDEDRRSALSLAYNGFDLGRETLLTNFWSEQGLGYDGPMIQFVISGKNEKAMDLLQEAASTLRIER